MRVTHNGLPVGETGASTEQGRSARRGITRSAQASTARAEDRGHRSDRPKARDPCSTRGAGPLAKRDRSLAQPATAIHPPQEGSPPNGRDGAAGSGRRAPGARPGAQRQGLRTAHPCAKGPKSDGLDPCKFGLDRKCQLSLKLSNRLQDRTATRVEALGPNAYQ